MGIMMKFTLLMCFLLIAGMKSHAISKNGPGTSTDRSVTAKTVGEKDVHNVVSENQSGANSAPKGLDTVKPVIAVSNSEAKITRDKVVVANAKNKDAVTKPVVEKGVNSAVSESQSASNANPMDLGTVKSVDVASQKNSIAESSAESSGNSASEKAVLNDSAAKESKIATVVEAAAKNDLKSQTMLRNTPIVTTKASNKGPAPNSRFVKTRKGVTVTARKPTPTKTAMDNRITELEKEPQVSKFRELIALNETGAALNISTQMIGALLQTPIIHTYNCSTECSPLWLMALKKIVGKLPPTHPICTTGSYTSCLTAGSVCANEPTKIVCCPIACLTPIMPCYQGPPADNMCIPIDVSHWLEKLKAQG